MLLAFPERRKERKSDISIFFATHAQADFTSGALKKTGLIKNKLKSKYPRRKSQIPFSYSLNAIESFLKQQGTYKGTHESIYKELRIPKSTYFLLLNRLKKQGKISMRTLRVGKTWVTGFKYFDSLRKEYKDMSCWGGRSFKNSYSARNSHLLGKFNNFGLTPGFRNDGLFAISRNLAFQGYSKEQILGKLRPGLEISSQFGHGFDDKEIERTIKSACKPGYKYPFRYNNDKYQKLLKEFNLDRQNTPKPLENSEIHSGTCDCSKCISMDVDIEFNPREFDPETQIERHPDCLVYQ